MDTIIRMIAKDAPIKAMAIQAKGIVERAREIHKTLPVATAALGRTLLDGTPSVKLFGEDVAVRAKVVNFQGLSSHADHDHLLDWISHFKEPKPQHVFVVHGDREVAPVFAQTVSQLGFTAHAPQYTEEYDLLTCTQLAAGYLPQRKTRTFEGAPRVTAAYQKLVQLGDSLVGLIQIGRAHV